MNTKLIVFILAFAAYGLLPCADANDDGQIRFDLTISLPDDTIDAISVDDMPNLPTVARKFICATKLLKVVQIYRSMENITESDFNQLCKNFTEVNSCGPEKDFLNSGYCPDPVLDQVLKDNACQTSCAMDALTRYARNFCSYDALPVFMAYGKETMIKYLTLEKCFETCPSRDWCLFCSLF